MKRKLILLHEVPRNSTILIEHLGLSFAGSDEIIKEAEFRHVDGMYSVSYVGDKLIHLKSDTKVYVA